jgi:hypothetical protein
MSYQYIVLVVFLFVLLASGITLIADAGMRLLRGQRR